MAFRKPLIVLFLTTLVLLWATPAHYGISAPVDEAADVIGRNNALIIGINDYQNWPKMKSPVGDAEKLAKLLIERYDFRKDRVTLLTDKTADKPTLVNILTQLDRYQQELTERDNLLIFFSGHGTEDDDGETYWVPIDGKKNSKLTWLSHSAISEEVLTADSFKAKNLCILTDSVFSQKLLRKRSVSLTPYDLRYQEKIVEKAAVPSREVISFGDQHWPGSAKTDGMGLFAFYTYKALSENPLDIVDFENLLFDENVLFPITKIAGTRLVRGRLQSDHAQGGQFVIEKVAPAPVIDVLSAEVQPKKGYPGEGFTIQATTASAADEVILEFGDKRIRMSGENTHWRHRLTVDEVGSFPFRVAAVNRNAQEGKAARGRFFTVKPQAPTADVVQATVSPETGLAGDEFTFAARTSTAAESVALRIGSERFAMQGDGTRWKLTRPIDDIGTVDFSVSAMNADGVEGKQAEGKLAVKAGKANVVALEATPKSGYAGEEFTVTARTDRPAAGAVLRMDGKQFEMAGSNRTWRLKQKISEVGEKRFTVVARNVNGTTGESRSGLLIAEKTPLPIPDVTDVQVSVVSPGKGYAGDRFSVTAKTSAPSEAVFLEIGDTRIPMEGSGTRWQVATPIEKAGLTDFRVVARNPDGMQGRSREGRIRAEKRPALPVNVLVAEASPQKGIAGQQFVFRALTDRPSSSVTLQIGKGRYEMEGSGSEWILEKAIDDSGKLDYKIVARNEDGKPGPSYSGEIDVFQERYRLNADGTLTDLITGKQRERFIDKGDGTVIDRATSLMWMKQPKQIALNWENAVEYCRSLDFRGYDGWRLPTIAEFEKLIDKKRQNPALPPNNPFENVITHVGYWSKTRHRFGPRYVYQMSLWYGKASHLEKDENAIVWPVRYVELGK